MILSHTTRNNGGRRRRDGGQNTVPYARSPTSRLNAEAYRHFFAANGHLFYRRTEWVRTATIGHQRDNTGKQA